MTIEVLNKELIQAIKNGETLTRDVLRNVIGSIKKVAIDKGARNDISESLVNEVLLKEKKILQEMIDTCPIERVETLNLYKEKMEILEKYVPQLITNEQEVKAFILDIVNNEIGFEKSNRGKIMKVLAPAAKGKVDMGMINKVLTEMLR